jgi:hypothetical protein
LHADHTGIETRVSDRLWTLTEWVERSSTIYWYETPANIAEFQNMFGHFEPMW